MSALRLYMDPAPEQLDEGGIRRVLEAYRQYLPRYDVQFVPEYDQAEVTAVHVDGTAHSAWSVLHCHGLYWSADYAVSRWELAVNAKVIGTARRAREVVVPSEWVAESFRRDMRLDPVVVGHGVEWERWQVKAERAGHLLWNKNRLGDVCDPAPLVFLAQHFPQLPVVTTFWPQRSPRPSQVKVTGLLPHAQMMSLVSTAEVYLATTKETFGIGTLEAMAAGLPILGYADGGILEMVQHGVNGYLAAPGDLEDLAQGLDWCLQHRALAGENSRELAKRFTWDEVCQRLAQVYRRTLEPEPDTIGVVIPCYRYGNPQQLGRALLSVLAQTTDKLTQIVVVDDGGPDPAATAQVVASCGDARIRLVRQANAGVAVARNTGLRLLDTTFACCLDADDAMEPGLLETCWQALRGRPELGVAYTGLRWIKPDGSSGVSAWPGAYNFDLQLQRKNQIPTCSLFRRKMWARLGGYRQRYAPGGAGAEDAEFWLRCGAYGWGAVQATEAPLFLYSQGSGQVSGNPNYREEDWTTWHPWVTDGQHPFASLARPSRFSHPVRQYDHPVVSVVIPVGPGHEELLFNALDSLEAQTLRQWEAIAVFDGCRCPPGLLQTYPYLRVFETRAGPQGAGAARNLGAVQARGSRLLFLDADDHLYPQCLQVMLDQQLTSGAAVYSDYVMLAYVDHPEALAKDLQGRIYLREESGRTVLGGRAAEYNPERAQQQPDPSNPYLWNLVTTMFPTAWHAEVGGFDETLPSWEDVDYWWRLARLGKCFQRVPQELVVYRSYAGQRREAGREAHAELMKRLVEKFKGVETMPCSGGCGGSRRSSSPPALPATVQAAGAGSSELLRDDSFVRILYAHPNQGQHSVIGYAAFTAPLPGVNMLHRGGEYFINYGYRQGGEIFLVHRADVVLSPDLFQILPAVAKDQPLPVAPPAPEPVIAPSPAVPASLPAPEPVAPAALEAEPPAAPAEVLAPVDETQLRELPEDLRLSPTVLRRLNQQEIFTVRELIQLGLSAFQGLSGLKTQKARETFEAIVAWAEQHAPA